MITESKLWRLLKPYFRRAFRIETSTALGVPDIFAVLPSGRPVWIEMKIARRGHELRELLRPGQVTFRQDYNEFIPVIILAALPSELCILMADVNGRILSATEVSWREAIPAMLKTIEEELKRDSERVRAVKQQSSRAAKKKTDPGNRA